MENNKNIKKNSKKGTEEVADKEVVIEKPSAKKTADTQAPTEKSDWKKDGRLSKIVGLVLLFSSLVIAYSFTSFLFTFTEDASELNTPSIQLITQSSNTIKNAGGSLGALVSSFFIQNLFGLASYLFCAILFMFGSNLFFQKKIFKAKRNSLYIFIGIVWLSAFLGFINYLFFPETAVKLGGNFGNFLNGHDGILMKLIKPIGISFFLAATALSILIWVYNIDFGFLLTIFDKKEIDQPTAATTESEAPLFTFDEPTEDYRDDSENIFGKDKIDELKNEFSKKTEPILPMEIETNQDEESVGLEEEIVNNSKVKKTKGNNPALEIEEEIIEETVTPFQLTDSATTDTPKHIPNLSTPFDPTQELSNFQFPSLELLDEHSGEKIKYNPEELEQNKNQIISTLNNYQIEISKIKATIGPTVTLYEIVPAAGVRISKIKNLEDDIALSLAALGIRIIAPIPGKGTIGIEVPNVNKEVVSMRSLLMSDKFQNTTADLPICLGKSISNEIIVADLAKMPHLLMAGATGQGKSVGINSILVSLLYKKHPSQLKFIMVDPKKVELSLYEALEKHYLAKLPGEEDAIITDTKKVVTTLNALCLEMDNRYELLKKAQVRNIKEYNHKFINRQLNPQNGHEFLPYIVLVVDEFADLIMTAGKEVEMPIARLAQLARAIGIHLILATQRPSVNIITGTIKANFPARIAFKTTSKIDSRTILDTGGAEQLIGRGDMLLSQGSDVIRLQCGFVDTPEVEKIRDFISNQQGFSQAFMLPEYIDPKEDKGDTEFLADGGLDPLFEDAARIIVQNQMGSTSLIQRRMKLGYNRAGRLMDQLEAAGIVGENVGSKAREVKIKTDLELEQFLQQFKNDSI